MESKETECGYCHNHGSGALISPAKRLILSAVFIVLALVALKPFLFSQICKRGGAYVAYPLYDDAVRQYKKALVLNGQSDDAWDRLGYAYKGKGDTKKAVETYRNAIKINSGNVMARFDLGMIYLINGDFDNAAGCFRYIVAMGKENEAASSLGIISYHHSSCSMLVTCYEKMGKKDLMARAARMTLKFYPDDKKAKDELLRVEGLSK